jgi:hypothetical protein
MPLNLHNWQIVKNSLDIKPLTVFAWVNIASAFIMRIKQLNWCGYYIEKKSIATSPKKNASD